MKRGAILGAALVLLATTAWGQQRAGQKPEQQVQASPEVMRDLRNLASNFDQAWNQQDLGKMANYYTTDGMLVMMDGRRVQGRNQIRQTMQQELTGQMKGVQSRIELGQVHMLGPQMAMVEFRQHLTRQAGTGGAMMEGTGGAGEMQQQGQGMPHGQMHRQQAMQFPLQMEGISIVRRVGNQWLIHHSHLFPSRQMMQQPGVGGAGEMEQPVEPEPMPMEPME